MDSLDRKRKKIVRKGFRHWLTHRFRLLFLDEDELRTMKSSTVSRIRLIAFALVICILVSFLGVIVYKNSPLQKRVERRNQDIREQLVENLLLIDSLESVMNVQEKYAENIQNVLLGKVSVDSLPSLDSLVSNRLIEEQSEVEQNFISQYEEQERYNVTLQSPGAMDVKSRNLFCPASGVIAEPFNASRKHYGVDIAASPNESVVSVADGTVMLSSYTAEDGFVICIHHTGDMVSVYKYCSKLMKKEGDKVHAGDVIALVGAARSSYSSSHLHFELWYEGQPLDPQKYIVF